VVKATSKQSINNVAEVRSQEPDPDLSDNTAEVQYQVNPVTDLSVAIEAKGEVQVNGQPAGNVTMVNNQVTAGRSVEYVVTVKNDGVSTAENVVLEDVLPMDVTPTSIVASSGNCSAGLPGNPTVCGLGNMASGASATVTIRAGVLASEPAGKVLVSNATVYSDVPDAENAFNFDTNLTTVNAWADLSLEKSNLTADVLVGGQVKFKIEVGNDGPSDAMNAVVMDMMPSGISGVSWQCTGFSGAVCSASGSGDIMDEVDLPVGGWMVYTVTATRDDGDAIVNEAGVTVPNGVSDPQSGNSSDSATVEKQSLPAVYTVFAPMTAAPSP
jgi:uncharacterized repeat protein (TIGR01451 family)